MTKFIEIVSAALVSTVLLWLCLSCLDIAYNSLYQNWNLIKLMLEMF